MQVWQMVWIIHISDASAEFLVNNTAQQRVPAPVGQQSPYLATFAFPTVPGVHVYAVSCQCFGAKEQDSGLYALDVQPKTMEKAVDCMLFYQYMHQHRPALKN